MKVSAALLCAIALGCATNSSAKKPASEHQDEWDRTRESTRPSDPSLDPTAHEPTSTPPQSTPPAAPPGAAAPTSERRHAPARDRTLTRGDRTQHAVPIVTPERVESPSRDTALSARSDKDGDKKRDEDRGRLTESPVLTPLDQGNGREDLRITQEIRRAVIGDDSLSFTAKNVKIITVNGKVTLRGPVDNESERKSLEAAARRVAGVNVDSQLEVKR
jgi:hypothetical protein